MGNKISLLEDRIEQFLQRHTVQTGQGGIDPLALQGDFSLYPDAQSCDLYGMIDIVYILFTINQLSARTNRKSRREWADRILACQDENGWFSRLNLRGHSMEHATAYAIGALTLLQVEKDEEYISGLRPLAAIRPLLSDRALVEKWLNVLDFRLSPKEILNKKLGWHYIWRGSHVGGGIPAAISMTSDLHQSWWQQDINLEEWFTWYFDWLDSHASPQTGYWQQAFWNRIYTKPTLIDMGGAVHFYWVYDAHKRPLSYPERIVHSTLSLQKETGLYKDHPFCIDLDGNFCLLRAYLQLPKGQQSQYTDYVRESLLKNYSGVLNALTAEPLDQIYTDSHGLPGALAALVECRKFPDFEYAGEITGWKHPLDKVCWL